jgi:hypothetical protein
MAGRAAERARPGPLGPARSARPARPGPLGPARSVRPARPGPCRPGPLRGSAWPIRNPSACSKEQQTRSVPALVGGPPRSAPGLSANDSASRNGPAWPHLKGRPPASSRGPEGVTIHASRPTPRHRRRSARGRPSCRARGEASVTRAAQRAEVLRACVRVRMWALFRA